MTFACEDKIIEAHKAVLGTNSPFFKNLLINNDDKHPFIYITGVKYIELTAILDLLYLGEASIGQEQLTGFFIIAEEFGMKDLKIYLCNFFYLFFYLFQVKWELWSIFCIIL